MHDGLVLTLKFKLHLCITGNLFSSMRCKENVDVSQPSQRHIIALKLNKSFHKLNKYRDKIMRPKYMCALGRIQTLLTPVLSLYYSF